jgi:hypothetical protein
MISDTAGRARDNHNFFREIVFHVPHLPPLACENKPRLTFIRRARHNIANFAMNVPKENEYEQRLYHDRRAVAL